MKVLDTDGILYLWQKIKNRFADKSDLPGEATQAVAGLLSASDKQKLDGAESGAQANVIETIQLNGTALPVSGKSVNVSVPTNNNQLINGAGYQTAAEVESAISARVSGVYKAGGSVASISNLPALSAANLGMVVNLSADFTTTADFVEGAGKSYSSGTNIAIVTAGENVYKYDVLAGFMDLSDYLTTTDVTAISNAEIDAIVAT